ncbi:hypothetical protein [Vibrio phage vB_VpaP_SJSY21]|nr:hypothetical protein [Vibrio phage vB_VpaP_SJSY21]
MKINIKNARRLETAIEEEISRIRGKINGFSDKFDSKDKAEEGTFHAIIELEKKWSALQHIRFEIRNLIGKFNSENDINVKAGKIALLSERADLIQSLSTYKRSTTQRNYSNDSTYYSAGLSETVREEYHSDLLSIRREIQRLKDQCQGINASGTIELDSDAESFLKKAGLMD